MTDIESIPSSVFLTLMRSPKTATDTEKINLLTDLTRTSTGHTKFYFNRGQAEQLAHHLGMRGYLIAKYWITSIYPFPSDFSLDGLDGCYTYCVSSKLSKKKPKTLDEWKLMMKLPSCVLDNSDCCEFAKNLLSDIEENVAEIVTVTEKSSSCVICLDGKSECACIPCGHKCICIKCKEKTIDKCPICRTDISTICRIYD